MVREGYVTPGFCPKTLGAILLVHRGQKAETPTQRSPHRTPQPPPPRPRQVPYAGFTGSDCRGTLRVLPREAKGEPIVLLRDASCQELPEKKEESQSLGKEGAQGFGTRETSSSMVSFPRKKHCPGSSAPHFFPPPLQRFLEAAWSQDPCA